MKYYSYGVSLCVIVSVMMHAKNLWIENKTDDLLNLVVSKGDSEVILPLFAGKLQVLEEPEKLTTLYVEPTGMFARGFLRGKNNLAAQAKSELEKATQDLSLIIEPSSLISLKTSFKPHKLELLQPSLSVIRYFPQVVRVIQEREKISPYDFFGLQDKAPREAVDMAYTSHALSLKSLLEAARDNEAVNYYRELLAFVNAAYDAIIHPGSQELATLLANKRAAARLRLMHAELEEDKERAERIAGMRKIIAEMGLPAYSESSETGTGRCAGGGGRRGMDKFSRVKI